MGKGKGMLGMAPLGCCALEFFAGLFVFFLAIAIIVGGGNANDKEETTKDPGTLENTTSIPDSLKPIFNAAASKYNMSPAFLASIFWKEHGESFPESGPWASSPAGANGPFQFIEPTWEGWSAPNGKNGIFETNINIIDQYGGYGQDGDGDGKADVQNLWDSAFAGADHLASNGAAPNTTDLDKLRDVASMYNSGKSWDQGQNIPETNDYVNSVIEEYQKLLKEM